MEEIGTGKGTMVDGMIMEEAEEVMTKEEVMPAMEGAEKLAQRP